MTESKLPQRPISGGNYDHLGLRPERFNYWRVGYGNAEGYALDFWLECAGEYHCKPNHSYPHDEYQIERWTRFYYLKMGEAECGFAGNIIHLKAGDLLISPPHHPFVYECRHSSHYHWFALAAAWPSLLDAPPRVLHFSPGYDAILETNFVAIRETLILQPSGYPLKAVSRFYDLMARLAVLQSEGMPASSSYPDAVRNAMIYLQENYNKPFSAAETAAAVHVSQSYLRALFEKWVGEAPKRYHTRCRIEQAKQLLRDQHLSVKVVAGLVGFADVSYFSRVFKQITGAAPSSW